MTFIYYISLYLILKKIALFNIIDIVYENVYLHNIYLSRVCIYIIFI